MLTVKQEAARTHYLLLPSTSLGLRLKKEALGDFEQLAVVALQACFSMQSFWEAVNKSAASAASLDGFSSRDQVGC